MLALGLLPLLAFGLLALVPMLDTTEPEDDDLLDEEVPIEGEDGGEGDGDPEGEGEDPVEGEGEGDGEGENPEAPASTVVTITDAEGETREIELDNVDIVDGTPVTVEGSELRDVVEASETPSVPLQLNTFGGDDAIDFGYSTSVDPGEGTDVLSLTITAEALANGDLEAGVVTFDDPLDALAIDIDDDATGFVHEVRVESSTAVDDTTTTETETLYYILSASETLTIDQAASAEAGEIVLGDGAQVLTQVDLGTLTRVTGVDENDEPTETVTGSINEDPTILLNRDVTSEQTFTLPTADAPDEEEEEEPPFGTIASNDGAQEELIVEDNRAIGTDGDDVIAQNPDADNIGAIEPGAGADDVTVNLGQTVFANDDEGDAISVSIKPNDIDDALALNAAADATGPFFDPTFIVLDEFDTLNFDLDAEIEGRLVQVLSNENASDAEGSTTTNLVTFYLVPDDLDVQALIDAAEAIGAPDENLNIPIAQNGGVALAFASLGTDDGEVNNQFDLAGLAANREIETFTLENTG